MFGDQGGWLFALMYVVGALALLAALAYGASMLRNRRRDPVTEQKSREATQHMYHHEDAEKEAKAEGRPTVDTTARPT
jgi:uncharacterized iron-regulated membrane protein